MYRSYHLLIALLLLGVMLLISAIPSYADSQGKKNTALALTGATVLSAMSGKSSQTALLGVASAAAWANCGSSIEKGSYRISVGSRPSYYHCRCCGSPVGYYSNRVYCQPRYYSTADAWKYRNSVRYRTQPNYRLPRGIRR